jgi:hypothetical protein
LRVSRRAIERDLVSAILRKGDAAGDVLPCPVKVCGRARYNAIKKGGSYPQPISDVGRFSSSFPYRSRIVARAYKPALIEA